MLNTDVAIIGGGIVGLAASIFLAEHSIESVVLEKGDFQERSLGIQIAGAAADILTQYTDIAPAQAIDMNCYLADGSLIGRAHQHAIINTRAELLNSLYRKAKQLGVTLLPHQVMDDIAFSQERVKVITNQHEYQAKHLLACDGAHSTVASMLNKQQPSRPYLWAHRSMCAIRQQDMKISVSRQGHFISYPVADKCNVVAIFNQENPEAIKYPHYLTMTSKQEVISHPIHRRGYIEDIEMISFLGDAAYPLPPSAALGSSVGILYAHRWAACFAQGKIFSSKPWMLQADKISRNMLRSYHLQSWRQAISIMPKILATHFTSQMMRRAINQRLRLLEAIRQAE